MNMNINTFDNSPLSTRVGFFFKHIHIVLGFFCNTFTHARVLFFATQTQSAQALVKVNYNAAYLTKLTKQQGFENDTAALYEFRIVSTNMR